MNNSPCFNLAEDWAPEAIQSASEGIDAHIEITTKPLSCASVVLRKMEATEEESIMAAGFAGGLGLSGNACGALAAAIWYKTLQWCIEHPGKPPFFFRNRVGNKILSFLLETSGGELRCTEICGN